MKKTIRRIAVILFSLVIVNCASSCGKKNDQDYSDLREKVSRIKTMARLGTVEYHVTKAAVYKDDLILPNAKRSAIFSFPAVITAGIDLNWKPDDIKVDYENKAIILLLPKATIDEPEVGKSTEEWKKVEGIRSEITANEKNSALKKGEAELKAEALKAGILQDAERNARLFLESFLRLSGFENIEIYFHDK